jgi:aspartyl-tRNA(Asn)/glutamyl-tRNA(Gln) amidotransferase subunit A
VSDVAYLSAAELAAAYRRGERSVVEVTTELLARVDDLDGTANAFVTVTHERALEDARRADRELADGLARPMCGIPYTIKDLVPTCGIPTGYGSLVWRDPSPAADAPVAERLARSGGVLLGKTTTPEQGFKGASGNPLNGPCSNPWQADRTPGGSSSGAAVAAALGFGPLHQGSDGAGSIRIPSAFCGVVGLKPTFGLVAHPPATAFGLSHIGPIARSVADAALLLDAMAGFDPRDRLSVLPCEGSYAGFLGERDGPRRRDRRLRLAFSPDLGYSAVDPGVAACVAAAARSFAKLGHEVEEVDLGLDDPWWIEREMWWAMFGSAYPEATDHRDRVSPGLVRLVETARTRTAEDLGRAFDARAAFARDLAERLQSYDLLLCPSLPCTAFPIDRDQPESVAGRPFDDLGWTGFCYPFNLTGQPAASVPCGFVDGLPVGLQIVGGRLDDALVLQAAAAFEATHPFQPPAPE